MDTDSTDQEHAATADGRTPQNTDVCCGGAVDWIDRPTADELAGRLAAVADPIRLQVLSIISNAPSGEVCACDFVEPLGKSQPTISHHLKVLAEAGLVAGDKRGRWVWYRLGEAAVGSLAASLTSLVESSEIRG